MLDIKFIRENPDIIKQEAQNRGLDIDVDKFLNLDKRRRELLIKIEKLREEQNKTSDEIVKQKTKNKKQKMINRMKKVSELLRKLDPELKKIEVEIKGLMDQIPNISHKSVPIGKNSSGNVVERKWGKKPEFDFRPKEHFEIESIRDLIDFERAAKVSGTRFWYLKGKLAKLEFALMQYAFDFFINKGFEPMIVPMLVRKEAMYGSGFFPADKNEIYKVNPNEDNLYLIGTSEVSLAAYHMNEIIDLENGPKKYMGYSGCFRREAGAYGKDKKGIFRGHQFNKIEMFIFCKPEDSWKIFEYLLKYSEEFLRSLNLHYQVVNMCTGDLGTPNAKKYDIETWMPGLGKYCETNSCSNDTDFQARRLNCKFKDKDGKNKFVHTLNNTGCADRILIAILENYQQKDGTVKIPESLRKYTEFDKII